MSSPALVLHPSLLRLGLAFATPLAVLAFTAWGVATGASGLPVAVAGAVGVVLTAIVLVDLPLAVEFDAGGITRVCVLRRQRLPWEEVHAIVRPATSALRPSRGDGPSRRQGLVVRVGTRRHVLLVDRCESHAEWTVVRDLVADRATALTARAPDREQPPAGRGPRALHRAGD